MRKGAQSLHSKFLTLLPGSNSIDSSDLSSRTKTRLFLRTLSAPSWSIFLEVDPAGGEKNNSLTKGHAQQDTPEALQRGQNPVNLILNRSKT